MNSHPHIPMQANHYLVLSRAKLLIAVSRMSIGNIQICMLMNTNTLSWFMWTVLIIIFLALSKLYKTCFKWKYRHIKLKDIKISHYYELPPIYTINLNLTLFLHINKLDTSCFNTHNSKTIYPIAEIFCTLEFKMSRNIFRIQHFPNYI